MVSLIICTHNRCESLKETLTSLIGQKTDKDFNFEILAIDNASTDGTKSVVESFKDSLSGRLRYLFEAQKGKPYAMNLGIKEAKGDIIAFIDDDCLVEDPDFLLSINRVFQEQGLDIGFMGGKILPKWTGEPPAWLTESLMGPLALLDYGNEPFVLEFNRPDINKRLFYGANYAFRKKVFQKYGDINVAKTLAQDTDICLRMLTAGVKGYYAPQICVKHKVPTGRLTPQYFYQWYYKRGIYHDMDENYKWKFYHPFGIPFWIMKQTVVYSVKSLLGRTVVERINNRCWACYNLGRMVKLTKSHGPKELNIGCKKL